MLGLEVGVVLRLKQEKKTKRRGGRGLNRSGSEVVFFTHSEFRLFVSLNDFVSAAFTIVKAMSR